MALLSFFNHPSYLHRPSRLLDQHFGLALDPEDFLEPLTLARHFDLSPAGYLRPWRTALSQRDVGSTLTIDKEKFQANLDVQQFKPEEIKVKLTGDTVTIEGKHEEKEDEHGYISRHFVRKYVLPKNCDVKKLESKLSSDGILTITAPKTDMKEMEQKEIPIHQTGEPMKKIDKKKEEKKK